MMSLDCRAVSEDNIPGLFRREEPVQEQHSVGNSSFFSAADADELHYAASSIQDRMSFYEGSVFYRHASPSNSSLFLFTRFETTQCFRQRSEATRSGKPGR